MREYLPNREKQAAFIVRVSSGEKVLPTRKYPLRARRITRSFGEGATVSSRKYTPEDSAKVELVSVLSLSGESYSSEFSSCKQTGRRVEHRRFTATETADRATKPILPGSQRKKTRDVQLFFVLLFAQKFCSLKKKLIWFTLVFCDLFCIELLLPNLELKLYYIPALGHL
tara:strand:+ start:90950 stop:91459 length:510 start_codon:yes stop_codon:yes gene_type:complete